MKTAETSGLIEARISSPGEERDELQILIGESSSILEIKKLICQVAPTGKAVREKRLLPGLSIRFPRGAREPLSKLIVPRSRKLFWKPNSLVMKRGLLREPTSPNREGSNLPARGQYFWMKLGR